MCLTSSFFIPLPQFIYFFLLRRMQTHDNSLKREFLKKWIKGIQICNSTKEKMSLLERKKAIKLSADLALASTRIGKRTWSHALISKATNDAETGNLAKQILLNGDDDIDCTKSKCNYMSQHTTRMMIMSRRSRYHKKRIVSRKKEACKFSSYKVKARSMAKKLVKKRTQILKGLIPGGEYMIDEYSLFKETLDYVVSLRAQVDVMHHLANSPQYFIHN